MRSAKATEIGGQMETAAPSGLSDTLTPFLFVFCFMSKEFTWRRPAVPQTHDDDINIVNIIIILLRMYSCFNYDALDK